jgi:hypothetical protein
MMPHLFYSQLVILGLLWLWVLRHYAWPDRSATVSPRRTAPIKPPRKRAHEPKPCAGLTPRPHCAVCEHADAHPQTPPPIRPDPMPPTNRRPREVDASRHFGPHAGWR